MGKTKRTKQYQELTFLITTVLMLIILIAVIFGVLSFSIKCLNKVLNPNLLQYQTVIQFNLEGFKNLGLIKSL